METNNNMREFTAIYGESNTMYSFKAASINNAIEFVKGKFDESVQASMVIIENTPDGRADEGKIIYAHGKRIGNYVVVMDAAGKLGRYVFSSHDVDGGGFADLPCSIEDAKMCEDIVLSEDGANARKASFEQYCRIMGIENVSFRIVAL